MEMTIIKTVVKKIVRFAARRMVFQYKNKPTNNFLGTDGSYDVITLYDNGILHYERFLFRCDMPCESKEIGPFPEAVTQVEKILSAYASEIERFPDFIDNNFFDGSWQHFRLGERTIIVDNMMYYSEEDIRMIHLYNEGEKLEKIMTSVRQTNTMVEIFCKITAVIKESSNFDHNRQ